MKSLMFPSLALAMMSSTGLAIAAPTIGAPAPTFSLTDSQGQTRSLQSFAGKTVVLEWTNAECPFVKKHYGAGNMQKQQADATAAGVVWLTINSSAPGKQGHVDAAGAERIRAQSKSAASHYLLDPAGTVGKLYAAKTTPHMFIIDASGTLRYAGGIDSIASADPSDIADAVQYVPQALAELGAGQAITVALSAPYGCSVKYAD